MSRLPNSGSDSGAWGTILNDYLGVAHNVDGSEKTNPFGTGLPHRVSSYAPPSALAVEILVDTPKLYWQLNDPLGSTTVADSSGLAHTGTVGANVSLGGLGLGNRTNGSAWSNEPASGGQVSVGAHADFNVADVFSIEFCVRFRQDFDNIGGGLFDTSAAGSGGPAITFPGGAPRLVKQFGTTLVTSTTAITDTHLWHHLIVTKTGATIKIWLDGIDVTGSISNSTFGAQNNSINILNNFTRNSMCHVAFYNTALNSTRVGAHYAAFVRDNSNAIEPVKIGLHTDSIYSSTTLYRKSQMVTAKAVGATMARATVLWENAQTSGGASYTWTRHDEYVQYANENGVTPLFVFAGSPTWLTSGSDRWAVPGVGVDTTFKQWVEAYCKFVVDFVDRYKPDGNGPNTTHGEFWCEIWNEPNLDGFWNTISVNTAQQWADQYAYFYKSVRATILSRCRNAKIIFGGLSSWGAPGGSDQGGEVFLRKVIGSSSWTNTYIDYLGYHPYSHLNDPDNTTSFDNHFNDPIEVKDVLATLGYPYAPICLTEFGFADTTSQADQAAKLTTSINRIINEWSSFVPLLIWFDISDDIQANFGLYTTMPSDGSAATAAKTSATNYSAIALPMVSRVRSVKPPKVALNPSTATAADITNALIALGLVDKA